MTWQLHKCKTLETRIFVGPYCQSILNWSHSNTFILLNAWFLCEAISLILRLLSFTFVVRVYPIEWLLFFTGKPPWFSIWFSRLLHYSLFLANLFEFLFGTLNKWLSWALWCTPCSTDKDYMLLVSEDKHYILSLWRFHILPPKQPTILQVLCFQESDDCVLFIHWKLTLICILCFFIVTFLCLGVSN